MVKPPSSPGSTVSIPAHQLGNDLGSWMSFHPSSTGASARMRIENSGISPSPSPALHGTAFPVDPGQLPIGLDQAYDRRPAQVDEIREVAFGCDCSDGGQHPPPGSRGLVVTPGRDS